MKTSTVKNTQSVKSISLSTIFTAPAFLIHWLVAQKALATRIMTGILMMLSAIAPAVSTFGQSVDDKLSATGATLNGFVKRDGTRLTLNNQPYKFTGLNIYNATSINNCWYTLGSGDGLDTALKNIDNATGLRAKVFRTWFFQNMSTRNGVRDWSAFDHTIAVAKANGFKIIPTLV